MDGTKDEREARKQKHISLPIRPNPRALEQTEENSTTTSSPESSVLCLTLPDKIPVDRSRDLLGEVLSNQKEDHEDEALLQWHQKHYRTSLPNGPQDPTKPKETEYLLLENLDPSLSQDSIISYLSTGYPRLFIWKFDLAKHPNEPTSQATLQMYSTDDARTLRSRFNGNLWRGGRRLKITYAGSPDITRVQRLAKGIALDIEPSSSSTTETPSLGSGSGKSSRLHAATITGFEPSMPDSSIGARIALAGPTLASDITHRASISSATSKTAHVIYKTAEAAIHAEEIFNLPKQPQGAMWSAKRHAVVYFDGDAAGWRWHSGRGTRREEGVVETKGVRVLNLAPGLPVEVVRECFGDVGSVVDCWVYARGTGGDIGGGTGGMAGEGTTKVGVVEYASVAEAAKAIEMFDGMAILGHVMEVQFHQEFRVIGEGDS